MMRIFCIFSVESTYTPSMRSVSFFAICALERSLSFFDFIALASDSLLSTAFFLMPSSSAADFFNRSALSSRARLSASAIILAACHAWITIVDTHVTTIVSAMILFIFGTGPVKGFATTLVFGLLANLFTAVFVSRVIFDWVLSRKQRGEALSI